MSLSQTISALSGNDDLSGFDCGDSDRNTWRQSRSLSGHQNDDSRTYLCRSTNGTVIGYYAIATSAIVRAPLPGRLKRNAPDPVSCILLAQLGVDKSCHGQGLGRELVIHAMRQAVLVAEIAGCRLLLVHPATDRAADWYRRFGFVLVEATPSSVMAMSLAQVRATLIKVDAA